MKPSARADQAPLDELLAQLAGQGFVSGILLLGTTGTAALTPASDYDLLLVFDALPVSLRMVTTWVEGRLTEVYCTTAQTIERVAENPAAWSDTSEEGILVNWLRDGRIVHDRNGRLASIQERVRQGTRPAPATVGEVYEARRKIAYNVAQLKRYLAADDQISQVVVDLRLLYSLFEVAVHYFTVRRLPWRGEKQAVWYWANHDPEYLNILRRCLAERDRQHKVGLYEELAQRTLAPVGGLWKSGATIVATGVTWGAGAESAASGTVEDALAFWQTLSAGETS